MRSKVDQMKYEGVSKSFRTES